jgi:hypothetical protein
MLPALSRSNIPLWPTSAAAALPGLPSITSPAGPRQIPCRSLAILRGQRWLKILWKTGPTRRSYDPDLHVRNQLKHGSWLLPLRSA